MSYSLVVSNRIELQIVFLQVDLFHGSITHETIGLLRISGIATISLHINMDQYHNCAEKSVDNHSTASVFSKQVNQIQWLCKTIINKRKRKSLTPKRTVFTRIHALCYTLFHESMRKKSTINKPAMLIYIHSVLLSNWSNNFIAVQIFIHVVSFAIHMNTAVSRNTKLSGMDMVKFLTWNTKLFAHIS